MKVSNLCFIKVFVKIKYFLCCVNKKILELKWNIGEI